MEFEWEGGREKERKVDGGKGRGGECKGDGGGEEKGKKIKEEERELNTRGTTL